MIFWLKLVWKFRKFPLALVRSSGHAAACRAPWSLLLKNPQKLDRNFQASNFPSFASCPQYMHRMAASVLNTLLRQNEEGPHENSLARPPMAPAGIRKPPCSIQHELGWRRNGGCGIALLFSGNRSQSQLCTLDLIGSISSALPLPVSRGWS